MTIPSTAADAIVGFAGIAMVLAPVVSKPTVPFGVRVPPERTDASIIRTQRRAYACRTATFAACCTAAAFLLPAGAAWWLPRLILLLPVAAGLLAIIGMYIRAGQGGFRLAPAGVGSGVGGWAGRGPATADRDDDRFWKAGFLYVNRDDPALMVAKRFGVGWTVNLGNPAGWLLIAALVGTPIALSAVLAALHA